MNNIASGLYSHKVFKLNYFKKGPKQSLSPRTFRRIKQSPYSNYKIYPPLSPKIQYSNTVKYSNLKLRI